MFIGSEIPISLRTIGTQVKSMKNSRYYDFMRNLKFFFNKDKVEGELNRSQSQAFEQFSKMFGQPE